MTITEARAHFPGLKDKIYLDAAAVSLTPVQAVEGDTNIFIFTI